MRIMFQIHNYHVTQYSWFVSITTITSTRRLIKIAIIEISLLVMETLQNTQYEMILHNMKNMALQR